MNILYAFIKRLSSLSLGTIAGALSALLCQVMLARGLSIEEYGDFSAALAIVTLFSPLAAFGLSGLWLNIFGSEGEKGVRWMPVSFHYFIFSAVFVWLLILVWAAWGNHDSTLRDLIICLSFYVFSYGAVELVCSKYQLEEAYGKVSFWQAFPHIMRLFFILLIFLFSFYFEFESVYLYSLAYLIASVVLCVITIPILYKMSKGEFEVKLRAIDGKVSLMKYQPRVLNIFKMGWPYGLGVILHLIYFQSGVVLLKYFSGSEAAAIYSVVFLMMSGVYLLPTVVYQRLMQAKIHYWYNFEPGKFLKASQVNNAVMLVIGVIFFACVILIAPFFVDVVFGDEYRFAIDVLYVSSICIPVRFLSVSLGSFLFVGDHAKEKAIVMAIVSVVNVFLNVILIPQYGILGTVYASIFSEILLFLFYFYLVKSKVLNSIKVGF